MNRFITLGDRKFKVIRICREATTSDVLREAIKNGNRLIDVVLSDGKGNILFCHEAKDMETREIKDDQENK